jgi:LDH2 family malate/lactate/ureidoglycolate dehydrogenase
MSTSSAAAAPPSHSFSVERVRGFIERAGAASGLREENLRRFVDGVLLADMRGIDSHGVYRVPFYCRGLVNGDLNPEATLRRVRGRGATELVDADNGLGVIVGQLGMLRAIDMAREFGVGIVAIANSNHAGILAAPALLAADAAMVGYFVSNAPALMAPWGGREAMLSNSPFAWAIPARPDPVVLDMACSNVARGRIRLAAQRDERIPLDWAIDADGAPTDDPHRAMEGLVMPMAGYKGYGLALINEILAAVLPGAVLSVDVSRRFLVEGARSFDAWGIGHLAMAMDISAFQEPSDFMDRVDGLVERIRTSEVAPGHERIMVPGEPESRVQRKREVEGIPISVPVLAQLREFADEFRLEPLS